MDEQQLCRALDGMFDGALLFHSFTDYARDYELIVLRMSEDPPRRLRYLFTHCVEAEVATVLTSVVWRVSLEDRLIDPAINEANGHVWGVRWQSLYPGAKLISHSQRAERWASELGIDIHEVSVETNIHKLSLVFSDLVVTEVANGYVPFRAQSDWQ